MIHFVSNQTTYNSNFNITTLDKVVEYCKTKKVLGLDTETSGMFNFINKVIMLQIGDKENQFVIDTRGLNMEPLREVLEYPGITKVLWNAKFDYKFIKHSFNIELQGIYDGFLVECILTTGRENRSLSLAKVSERDLGIKLDKEERNKFVGVGDTPFTDRQIKYGAADVEHLLTIKEIQSKKLDKEDLWITERLEDAFVEILGDIEINGFYINTKEWLKLDSINKERLALSRKALDNYVIDNGHARFIDDQLDLFSTDKKCIINWDSSRQVIPFLKTLGINTTVTEKGETKETCQEKHLKKFNHEFIDIYLEYKGKAKAVSTYGEDFLKNVNKKTGRIHSNYWQILHTGRISSSDPNLQNIPAGKDFRSCFQAEDGNILVVADYSAQEPRCLADASKDPDLIDFFLNGDGDIHSMVASKMYSVIEGRPIKVTEETHPDKRQMGKILNLKLNYGGAAFTVKDDLKTTEEEAQVFIDALAKAFPVKEEYFKDKIEETFRNGYILIDKVTKRKCYLEAIYKYNILKEELDSYPRGRVPKSFDWSNYYKLRGSIERCSKNYPIQGLSGSMTKSAAILLKRTLKNKKLITYAKIVNLVHDEIILECKEEYAEQVAEILSSCMEDAGKYFCKTVPMTANAVISKYWEH